MLVLSGERISELERLPGLRAGDQFLISRHYNLSSDRLFSKRLNYETLVKDAVNNLCAALQLSSAAFVEKYNYSRKNHGHDYSSVYVYARPLSAISVASGVIVHPDSAVPVAEMHTVNNGQSRTVTMYNSGQRYDAPDVEPSIGELKFMALRNLPTININAKDFDGWVYPDGSEYSARDFPAAYAIYGDGQSDSFKVPMLSNFIKLNPGVEKSEPLKKFPAVNQAIIGHTHELKQSSSSIDSSMEVTSQIPAAITCSDKNQISQIEAIHLGRDDPASADALTSEYSISNIKSSGLTITGGGCSTEELSGETTPNYNLLPVLIYIGTKAK